MACKRRRFVTDAFHQTTITCYYPRMVVLVFDTKACTQVLLCNCHTDCVCKTLTKWAGGDFDTHCVPNFWVAWR